MKKYQDLFNENELYITPSEVIEFLYCNRFLYFMNNLDIRQYEEKRYKVQIGKEKHDKKLKINKDYIRKKIKVKKVHKDKYLISKKYKIKGIVDEVLEFSDGSLAPLDYKFAEYKEKDFETYNIQMVLYAIMIEEMFKVEVEKYYLVYLRSKSLLKEVCIDAKSKKKIEMYLKKYLEILEGVYPKGTNKKKRCIDCCYKKICEE